MVQNKVFAIALIAMAGIVQAGQYDDTTFNAGGEISAINRTSYNNGSSSDLNNFKTSNSAGKLAIQKNEPGVNIFVGARFNQYFGGEIGFGLIQNASANVQNGGVASNKINNYYIDLLGFLNIASQVDLVGDLGVGWLQSKANVTNATFVNLSNLTQTKLGIRAGGGLQYYFAPAWATRAMIRYQDGNKNFLKSNVSFSIGILYTF
jgi:opacity protein-like surface antigen